MKGIVFAGIHRQSACRRVGRHLLRLGFFILPLAVIVSAPSTASAEDLTVGRLLASQCAQCHGTNGIATGDMDSLAGDQDLLEDLVSMLNEDHTEDVMEHQAHGYRIDQIRLIAEYYASLPEPGSRQVGDEDDEED